ncbi:MAG: hypothetical protein HY606_04780 [Planctomycetes bacterium]|nr:hypothetical protein [Planctomycetota bacterium]
MGDFADIFRLELRTGLGVDAGVYAGPLLHLGIGTTDSHSVGLRYGEFKKDRYLINNSPLSWLSSSGTTGNPFHLHCEMHKWPSKPEESAIVDHCCYGIIPTTLPETQYINSHALDIEADAFLILIGVRAGISPAEIADFILGIFGIDILSDDKTSDQQVKPDPEKEKDKKNDGKK